MNDKACLVDFDQFSDTSISTHERLVRLRATVLPDGEGTSFTVKYLNREEFKVYVPFEQIGMIYSQVNYAANAMLLRQSRRFDRGARKLQEMTELATCPRCMDVSVDPLTGDRIIIFQFKDQVPVVLRMPAEECQALSRKFAGSYH